MRHGKKFNHLGRTSAHRKAMLSNMATSLILHKRINTTLAKAKALRTYVEPLITRSKDDSTHSRRIVFSYLHSKEAVTELFREVSVRVASRPGGYTRILKTGNRLGDNAELCMMELVDYNEVMLSAKEGAKVKTTRRSRSAKAKTGDSKETTPKSTPKADVSAAEPVAGKPTDEDKPAQSDETGETDSEGTEPKA